MKQSFLYAPFLSALLLSGCGGGSSTSVDTILPADPPVDDGNTTQYAGSLPLLVIRLEYDDQSFVNNATAWHDKIFGEASHQLNNYYLETSYDQFTFIPAAESEGTVNDGVITVHLDKNHPDPDPDYWWLIQPDLAAAVEAADDAIDFSAYDTDGDNAVSYDELQVVFIVAGYEDAYNYGILAPGVWAHSSCLDRFTTPQADGVTLLGCGGSGRYALFGERHGNTIATAHDATIGIIAHELGHSAFLLPDLYDTDNTSSGIGYFGLMGTGSWGQSGITDAPGNTPVHPSAWSKTATGWVTPQVVSNANDQNVSLNRSASADYNVVKVPISSSEYFLLENRDNSGYDRGLYSLSGNFDGGLALWHIDEAVIDANAADNTVNDNENHKGVDLEEAANAELDSGGLGNEANLYYLGNVTAFTPVTNPNSASYSGSGSGIYVDTISSRGAVMTAKVTNPNP